MIAGGRTRPSLYFLEIRFLQHGSFDRANANVIPGSAEFLAKRNHSLIKQPDLLCTAGLLHFYSAATAMTGENLCLMKASFIFIFLFIYFFSDEYLVLI